MGQLVDGFEADRPARVVIITLASATVLFVLTGLTLGVIDARRGLVMSKQGIPLAAGYAYRASDFGFFLSKDSEPHGSAHIGLGEGGWDVLDLNVEENICFGRLDRSDAVQERGGASRPLWFMITEEQGLELFRSNGEWLSGLRDALGRSVAQPKLARAGMDPRKDVHWSRAFR